MIWAPWSPPKKTVADRTCGCCTELVLNMGDTSVHSVWANVITGKSSSKTWKLMKLGGSMGISSRFFSTNPYQTPKKKQKVALRIGRCQVLCQGTLCQPGICHFGTTIFVASLTSKNGREYSRGKPSKMEPRNLRRIGLTLGFNHQNRGKIRWLKTQKWGLAGWLMIAKLVYDLVLPNLHNWGPPCQRLSSSFDQCCPLFKGAGLSGIAARNLGKIGGFDWFNHQKCCWIVDLCQLSWCRASVTVGLMGDVDQSGS